MCLASSPNGQERRLVQCWRGGSSAPAMRLRVAIQLPSHRLAAIGWHPVALSNGRTGSRRSHNFPVATLRAPFASVRLGPNRLPCRRVVAHRKLSILSVKRRVLTWLPWKCFALLGRNRPLAHGRRVRLWARVVRGAIPGDPSIS